MELYEYFDRHEIEYTVINEGQIIICLERNFDLSELTEISRRDGWSISRGENPGTEKWQYLQLDKETRQ